MAASGWVSTRWSTVRSANKETISWSGTLRNGALEATAVHLTPSGMTEYWFKGKLAPAGSSPAAKEHPKKAEHPEHPKK